MTRTARGALLVAAAVCALTACNGTLRFDETPLDAGRDGQNTVDLDALPDGVAEAPADASCADGGSAPCGWRMTECEPNSDDTCERYCAAGLVCANGACGTGCRAECLENSTCAIATGDVSHLECKAGASCTVTLGRGGNAACAAGSSCHVTCTAGCAISCQAGATCQLRCGNAADFTTVTGTASCP